MFCQNCGSQVPDNSANCPRCFSEFGQPQSVPQYQNVNIPTNLVWAILTTLFCCQPLGIVAIIFAAQVSSKLVAGDIAGAQDCSKKAAMFSLIGFICGLIIVPIVIILQVMVALAEQQ